MPPAADIQTPAILKACTRAARALAELKGTAHRLPDPRILLIALPLQEARKSSAIENVITTTSNLFRAWALDSENTDPSTKEVLRYREAMEIAESRLKKNGLLTTRLFEEVCTKLTGADMRVRSVPGTRLENAATKKIIYTPPEGEAHLRALLANLENFIHSDQGIDPLIKMAVIHYQFEAIHPFTDGNGRTGRILNILYLIQQELLDLPILYLSRYLIDNRDDYYNSLAQITARAKWEAWILYMLKAIETTSKQTAQQIKDIAVLFEKKIDRAKIQAPNKHIKEMMEAVFMRPYIQIKTLGEHLGISQQTAVKYLRAWEKCKLLSSVKIGRRVLFINHDLMALLTEEEEGEAGM